MRATLMVLALVLAGSPAAADEGYTKDNWPDELILRPLTPARGMVSVELNISVDAASIPADTERTSLLIPTIAVGVTPRLGLALIHLRGLCLTGCDRPYNDLGLEARWAMVRRGELEAVLRGGPFFEQFTGPFKADLRGAVDGRWRRGIFALTVTGFVNFALNEGNMTSPNETIVGFTLRPQLQPRPWLLIHGFTGMNGPLRYFQTEFRIPVGLAAMYTSRRFDAGLQFAYANLLGKELFDDTQVPPVPLRPLRGEERELLLVGTIRF